jgi:SHS2 domain-containing protein
LALKESVNGAVKISIILYTKSMMDVKVGGFEEVAHTADLEIKVWGRDLSSLFTSAAEGMFHLSGIEDYEEGFSAIQEEISLNAMDHEGLLILFLEELLYRLTEDYMLFDIQKITIKDNFSLKAKLRGTQIKSYQRDIKAVTYHKLNIRETESGFAVNIVFDI